MARDLSLFTSFDKSLKSKVKFENEYVVWARGKGTKSIHTNSVPKLIHNVLLILDRLLATIYRLLLFVGRFARIGLVD